MMFIVFIAVFIYAVIKSKSRAKTALYTLGTVLAFIGVAFVFSLAIPRDGASIGTLAGAFVPIIGICAAAISLKMSAPPSSLPVAPPASSSPQTQTNAH